MNELDRPLRFTELMGLTPWRERWAQTLIVLRGAEDVPPAQWGLSSLGQLKPSLGIPLWRGRQPVPRKVILSNLFNHTQTPIEAGWSVKKTQARDFRGRDLTYDSHNGTDLAIPVRSTLLAAAAGRVVEVVSEFNRGGLKVILDHGGGLMTCAAHLARPLVAIGDVVERGQPIARTGYSGLDSLVTFPLGVPHVHFNTWLNGDPVDPFAVGDEGSLWVGGEPRPGAGSSEPFVESSYDLQAVDATLAGCKTPSVRASLQSVDEPWRRAALTVIATNYYPTRFPVRPRLYAEEAPRRQRLDLPFSGDVFDGVVFADDLG